MHENMHICAHARTHTHTHTYTVHSCTCRGESTRHVPSDSVDNAYPTGRTNSHDWKSCHTHSWWVMEYTRMHYVCHRSVVAPSHPRTIEVGGARRRRALARRFRAPTGSDQRHEECVARSHDTPLLWRCNPMTLPSLLWSPLWKDPAQ